MGKYTGNEKGFISLIAMLVVLALVCFFAYYVVNTYFGSQSMRETLGTCEVSTGENKVPVGFKSVVSDTRNKLQEMNKKSIEQFNQIEELKK